MLTVILVHANTTVTIQSQASVKLTPLGGSSFTTSSPTNGSVRHAIEHGIYKIVASTPPIDGANIDVIVTDGKDGGTDDPAIKTIRASFPAATTEELRKFLIEPESRG